MMNSKKKTALISIQIGKTNIAISTSDGQEKQQTIDRFSTPEYFAGFINHKGKKVPLYETQNKIKLSKSNETKNNNSLLSIFMTKGKKRD